jgi:hypothetical protein
VSEAAVREAFAAQARWCDQLGSPFTARLMRAADRALGRDTASGRAILDWAGPPDALGDSVPLRLAGALHGLVRAGRLPALAALYPPHPPPDEGRLAEALAAALAAADSDILAWLSFAPQTNEVARSGALYPGLMTVAEETGLPLALFEVGASAGLNLQSRRFAYDLGGRACGDPDSLVRLAPAWSGPPPAGPDPAVVARRGCDLAPIDVRDPGQAARLAAYVWPDQPERLARLSAAIAIARADPPRLDRTDAATWVEAHLAPQAGEARVLVHSIAYQYFPERQQLRIAAHMARAGERASAGAPLAWLAFEQDGAGPSLALTLWPGGARRVLATADAHARAVSWRG